MSSRQVTVDATHTNQSFTEQVSSPDLTYGITVVGYGAAHITSSIKYYVLDKPSKKYLFQFSSSPWVTTLTSVGVFDPGLPYLLTGVLDNGWEYSQSAGHYVKSDGDASFGGSRSLNTPVSTGDYVIELNSMQNTVVDSYFSITTRIDYTEYPQVPLFTSSAEGVNFNRLSNVQKAAIVRGSQLYDSVGGPDSISLPTILNAANLGGTTNVKYDFNNKFTVSGNYTSLDTSDADTTLILNGYDDFISLGTGSVVIEFLKPGTTYFSLIAYPKITFQSFSSENKIFIQNSNFNKFSIQRNTDIVTFSKSPSRIGLSTCQPS